MLKKKKLKREVLEPCIGSFTRSFGLFSIHSIEQRSLTNNSLIINDVNQYWNYYKLCPTQSNSPEAKWKDWLENLSKKKTITILK